jgi:sugar phosphate isomerase/epimerase
MRVTRRTFLAGTAALGASGLAGFGRCPAHAAEPLVAGTPHADQLGWRVGFSTYTFRGLTLFDTLEKIAKVGLRYAEMFAWQRLSPEHPNVQSGPGLSPALRARLKEKAAECNVNLMGCYTGLGSPDEAKAFFEFAADMGLEILVGEPPEGMFDAVEKLTEEYKIDFGLHNHAKPSPYWHPDTGLKALEGRSERMGFCCDTGHWIRSGLEPVEMLQRIGSRVRTFHMKDLDAFAVPKASDVVWGQGEGRIAGILAEVKRQGLKPYFGIEWERTADSEPAIHAESVAFFEKTAKELAAG